MKFTYFLHLLIRPLPGVQLDYPLPDPRLILTLPRQLAPKEVCIGNIMLPLIEELIVGSVQRIARMIALSWNRTWLALAKHKINQGDHCCHNYSN